MIAFPERLQVIPYALFDEVPYFLVFRPRDIAADSWELLRGEAEPNEPLPRAALRLTEEIGLPSIERVMDVHRSRMGESTLAVRVEAPDAPLFPTESWDEVRWVPFHGASGLLGERDRAALRKLNRILDVFLGRIEVIVEETHDEGGCTGGCCSKEEGGDGACTTSGCGESPFIDGRQLSGEKVVEAGAPKGLG